MRRAFTLVELLVVIAIIVLLAGMIVAVVGPIRARLAGQKTSSAMQSILASLTRRTAEMGGTISLAEHPLAGSALAGSPARRPAFLRNDGTAVSTALADALFGITLPQLNDYAVAGSRLLQPDDRYADAASPLMFGLPRRSLGILGAPRSPITAYRRLAVPTGATTVASTGGFLFAPASGTPEHDRAVALALGEDAVKALIADGVAWTPPADLPLGLDGRVWVGNYPTTSQRPGSTAIIGGLAQPYRIRGIALYDAWGRELLFESVGGGQIRIISAGRDGFFRFHPGADGLFATLATADTPSGDDRDAASDNIVSMPEQQ